MHPQIRQRIDAIAADNVSGATQLTRRAAEVLVDLPEFSDEATVEGFRRELTQVGLALADAQPSMAPLLRLVNDVLLAADQVDELGALWLAVQDTAQEFAAALERRAAAIARAALRLIPQDGRVTTLSSSATVLAVLRHAREADRSFRVICLESRPQREGAAFARRLAESGIATTLIVDAAAAHFMRDVQVVLVGADSVSPRGLVNKIGTFGLALIADAHGVPCYGLAGTEKLLPEALLGRWRIEERDPGEIISAPLPPHLKAINLYFDVTPLDDLAGLVTEQGVWSVEEVQRYLGEIRVHPMLRAPSSS